MTRPVSDKQRAANRRNARKSTGPRTPEGKARSARDARKHALLSTEVVVATGDGAERPEGFHALLDRLIREFEPRNAIEQALVERVAACLWRLRRAQRFEVGALRDALQAPDPDNQTLDKRIHCALVELRRLRSVPRRGTRKKNTSRKEPI